MAQVHDRWLEMDLSYFDPGADLERQVEQVWDRLAPLLAQVKGDYGIFFNVGWLIDLVTEWTGDPQPAYSNTKPAHCTMGGAFISGFG
jgi:hypothetical protein